MILSIVKQNCFVFKNCFPRHHVNVFIPISARNLAKKSSCARLTSTSNGANKADVELPPAGDQFPQGLAIRREREHGVEIARGYVAGVAGHAGASTGLMFDYSSGSATPVRELSGIFRLP